MNENITIEKRVFRPRLPAFLKQTIPAGGPFNTVTDTVRSYHLNTVCVEAKCPNRSHCFSRGTLAFQILGDICTRSCGFCAEKFGNPKGPIDPSEPQRVLEAATRLNLKHAVITSPARDDLADGGAGQFAAVVRLFREKRPQTTVEVLTPDFRAQPEALKIVFDSRPHIFNHNIETVRRLTSKVRSRASYERTLYVLKEAGQAGLQIKSGLMVGHGERADEIRATFKDLREAGVERLTIGQYLPPSPRHLPLVRLYTPGEFDILRQEALQYGFIEVSAGPLVRSSYHADEFVIASEASVIASKAKQSVFQKRVSADIPPEQQIASDPSGPRNDRRFARNDRLI